MACEAGWVDGSAKERSASSEQKSKAGAEGPADAKGPAGAEGISGGADGALEPEAAPHEVAAVVGGRAVGGGMLALSWAYIARADAFGSPSARLSTPRPQSTTWTVTPSRPARSNISATGSAGQAAGAAAAHPAGGHTSGLFDPSCRQQPSGRSK